MIKIHILKEDHHLLLEVELYMMENGEVKLEKDLDFKFVIINNLTVGPDGARYEG